MKKTRGGRERKFKTRKKYREHLREMRNDHMINTAEGTWRQSRNWSNTMSGKQA